MSKKINYSFLTSHKWDIDHPACVEPLIEKNYLPLTPLTRESSSTRKGAIFQKCPAHIDFLKNTFVFCAPFDLEIEIEIDPKTSNGKIFCSNISQEIFNEIVDCRFLSSREKGKSPYPILGIDWLCVFESDCPILMQVFPAFMHYNDFTAKTTLIPGEYNIGKWTRPVEVVFEIKNTKEKIKIKKGDAISYVKFVTSEIIELNAINTPWDRIKICNEIRQTDKFRPLVERYNSLEKIKQSACPYESKN